MVYKKVKLIENFDHIGFFEKIGLLLVYGNKKPSTTISIPWQYNNQKNIFVEDKDSSLKIKKLLTKINTPFTYSNNGINSFIDNDNEEIFFESSEYHVGKDERSLKNLVIGWKELDEEKIGRAYGFPSTSIDAFVGKRERFPSDYFIRTNLSPFTGFIFSKEFFKEELATTSKIWEESIKRISPKTYSEIKNYTIRSF